MTGLPQCAPGAPSKGVGSKALGLSWAGRGQGGGVQLEQGREMQVQGRPVVISHL